LSQAPLADGVVRLPSLRNEKSSSVYTTELITNILKEEGAELFDSRSASLGHTLQGGIPSPLDRARAVRLSSRCIGFLEQYHTPRDGGVAAGMPPNKRRGTLQGGLPTSTYVPESAAVITIQGSKIIFAPVQDVLKETDMKNRRGKSVWWRVRPCRRGLCCSLLQRLTIETLALARRISALSSSSWAADAAWPRAATTRRRRPCPSRCIPTVSRTPCFPTISSRPA
jgi:hypothetical protein